MRLSIRTRLMLWYAGSLTVLIAMFGLLIDRLMYDRLLARTDFEIAEELEELALEVGLAADRAELRRQLELRFGNHQSYDFVVQSKNEELLFVSQRIQNAAAAMPLTLADDDVSYSTSSVAGLGSCRIGRQRSRGPEGPLSIAVLIPLERFLTELQDLRKLLITVGPLIVLIAIGGGFWLARRALRPVDLMTAAADKITAEQRSERLQVFNPNDELGRLAVTLNQMIDRLQRALNDTRQFTADAAHELRTPLAVIRTTAEIALRHPRTTRHYEESLQSIADEAERLTSLSNQLLMLAREDAGLNESINGTTDIGELAREAVADIEPLAEQKDLSIQLICEEGVSIPGDPDRLRRVLINLLDNAIKYTPAGGRIDVTISRKLDKVELTVA
ncbi:MAG: HAMP domain-containing protein, partial [Fimbriimonadaceae bacterium]|nr:HAMP domain-containing protein [Fimbriimonadaceae bacterium]